MNKKVVVSLLAAVIIAAGGMYWLFDRLTGNNVEIESVLSTPSSGLESETEQSEGSSSGEIESTPNEETAPTEAAAASLDGQWTIEDSSKVYFSVTTSRETVNYELSEVTGSWTIDTSEPSNTAAQAAVAMTSMSSGNSQRDNHVASADYLDVAQYPEATFELLSFDGLSEQWTAGEIVDISFTGNMTVKGITKEVQFTGQAQYDGVSLKIEAATVVTFADFGMENPHNVVMDTENNLDVQLQLILQKA